jgi:hypothetical protein
MKIHFEFEGTEAELARVISQIQGEPLAHVPDASVPAAVEPVSAIETAPLSTDETEKQQKLLRRGEKSFSNFIHEWLKGIDMDTLLPREGMEQPDRDLLLRNVANGANAWAILQYVSHCGGLQQAIAKVTSSERLGIELARFIVPPASIAFYDLADLYEYKNPFKKEDDE